MVKPRRIPAFNLDNYLKKDSDETPFVFGKHRGYTPLWVAEHDPSYLVWAYETFTLKPCTQDLYELCKLSVDDTDTNIHHKEDRDKREELDGNLRFK